MLEHEAGILKEGEKSKDIQEIVNYRTALFSAHEYLEERPITLGFIRELHEVLLNSVRGQDKTPGEFRLDQNWIGPHGCSMEEATFVPPNPLQLPDHLGAFGDYLASDDIDILIRTAIMHAQFELLHPFRDGNGRIGRILIPLFLYQKKQLSQPMFYLSSYLESHREEYYQRLRAISQDGDWNGWIVFFLNAISIQAEINSKKVRTAMSLYDEMKEKIHDITHSQYSITVLDAIFNRPIFKTTDFVTETGINKQTAMGLLRQLKEDDILKTLEESSGSRPAVLCFSRLVNIAEGKSVV